MSHSPSPTMPSLQNANFFTSLPPPGIGTNQSVLCNYNHSARGASKQALDGTSTTGSSGAPRDSSITTNRHASQHMTSHPTSPTTAAQLRQTKHRQPHIGVPTFSNQTNNTSQPTGAPLSATPPSATHHRTYLHPPRSPIHPTYQTQSRLPPNTVARKAPRKATFIPLATVQGSKVSKPKPRTKSAIRQSVTPGCTLALLVPQGTPKGGCTPGLRRPRKLVPAGVERGGEEEKECEGGDTKVQESREGCEGEGAVNVVPSALPGGDVSDVQSVLQATVPLVQDETQLTTQPQCPRLRVEYSLTPELEGVRCALGPANWTEYLALMEKSALGEISGSELEGQEKRIFQVLVVGLRRRIRTMLLQCMAV
ncbi:hypothetical protein C7974DRAFT_410190 [Boeremia exigua]|uniref:uncharacterized protein n=1 Tax=Boeremia exigua TaxID=749465 RepID=UPI001E8D8C38|nr:uncharacterized protein C7974DRAFT_410190 [Boeremia exigua]KAH6639210.1 hypothetical protein C7974DRAFT_410190 [Boeremia exigua]